MDIPAPFQSVFAKWQAHEITVLESNWTSTSKRHIGAKVKMPDGQFGFAKLALNNARDWDEPDMLLGMQREVWWSKVIHGLRQHRPSFPFTSPTVLQTNVECANSNSEVSWIIFEHINGKPIVDWDVTTNLDQTNEELVQKFFRFVSKAVDCLFALNSITHNVVREVGMDDVPSLPHGSRRWLKKRFMDLDTAVLGNGAFEIGNIWETDDGQVVIMDNEFAGWYPRYDSLSYLYHRLYCNCRRPDMACYLCGEYVSRNDEVRGCQDDFYLRDLSRILQPRLLSGWYNDTVRRRLPPWHKNHRLRYWLYWHLRRNHLQVLFNKNFR
ncbi:MAG TPA: hypothetical protein VLG69_01270 [Candidatus Andersenbacteria bacterium]|nr:hypothetical protein [Candidatus Andersenbacteria bacterium]